MAGAQPVNEQNDVEFLSWRMLSERKICDERQSGAEADQWLHFRNEKEAARWGGLLSSDRRRALETCEIGHDSV